MCPVIEDLHAIVTGEIDPAVDAGHGVAAAPPRHSLGSILCNIALAGFYGLFVYAQLTIGAGGRWWSSVPIIIQELLMVILFLTRRPSWTLARQPLHWAVAVTCTLSPMLLRPTPVAGSLSWIGQYVLPAGLLLSSAALLSLGRSIGVVPANRGIKTGGAYRLVRHPIYAAYMVTFVGYIMCWPTLRNWLVIVVTSILFAVRAVQEESLLAHEPEYREYSRRVRWRLLPFVF
jgi:protein-S-isoprenylcysteine O-methyltransferase Ste14